MILVVCTGNTCRSPMAEGLLRHHLAEASLAIPVRSAGTLGWNGRPATPHAVEVMAERGIDISAHHSVKIATADVVAADLVLVMTRVHGGAIGAHCPERTKRTFLPDELVRLAGSAAELPVDSLSTWAEHLAARRPPGPLGRAQEEVADPAGEPIDAYRATADRLERTIARLVRALGALGGPDPRR